MLLPRNLFLAVGCWVLATPVIASLLNRVNALSQNWKTTSRDKFPQLEVKIRTDIRKNSNFHGVDFMG